MGQFPLTLLAVVLTAVLVEARHRHPIELKNTDGSELSQMEPEEKFNEAMSNFHSSDFVPTNNVLFFKRFPPCQEGFKRDILGVCREVW